MLNQQQIQTVVERIARFYKPAPEKIIVFGSYAADTANEQSDLDLLVVVNESNQPRSKRAKDVRKLLWGLVNIPKDILVYTQPEIDEWQQVQEAFITTVINTGKVVYENKSRIDPKLAG
jgi:predicted nucleotidyltransferase